MTSAGDGTTENKTKPRIAMTINKVFFMSFLLSGFYSKTSSREKPSLNLSYRLLFNSLFLKNTKSGLSYVEA
jgi:hypothetical protein